MASEIYSRYIPAKKPLKNSSSADDSILFSLSASFSTLTVPSTKPDASSTYARYIPSSSKAKDQPAIAGIHNDTSSLIVPKRKRETDGNGSCEHPPPKKSKTNDAGSSIRSMRSVQECSVQESYLKEASNTKSEAKVRKEGKKKGRRRPKDEGALSVSQHEEPSVDISIDQNSRHKSILSKKEKSLKKAEKLAKKVVQETDQIAEDYMGELVSKDQSTKAHPLEPLPQPEPIPELQGNPTFSALPPWLASPIRVSSTATSSFAELGILNEVIDVLRSKGFEHAFAVQTAVLPLLLPSIKQKQGDVLVSAATGSGKTLAYVLPMIEDISRCTVRRLRGLIIMPTRELVTQAREVCDICAAAFSVSGRKRVKVGIAVGSQQLRTEQASIMAREIRYDPEEYSMREALANSKWESSSQESDGGDFNLSENETSSSLPNHIIEYTSKVDILICTPGRLVEHMKSTPGFILDFIKWLIIDEADKLLDQSFQQWLDVVMSNLARRAKTVQNSNRQESARVTKVVLSATVTRDLGQLSALKLYRPKLVVLDGTGQPGMEDTGIKSDAAYNLPNSMREAAVKVENDGDKPLYLLQLLKAKGMIEAFSTRSQQLSPDDLSSENTSSSEDENQTSDSSPEDSTASESSVATRKHRKSRLDKASSKSRGVLIFTKSNETALRLSRLLVLLHPPILDITGTLTSTIRDSIRKATLRDFNHGKTSVLIASDLVSRGLDIPHLAHVINYDIPTSLTSYIHRVGRTARAGRVGHAWTLYSATEARWFWNEIARSEIAQRARGCKVERLHIDAKTFGEEERQRYETALAVLGKDVSESQSGAK